MRGLKLYIPSFIKKMIDATSSHKIRSRKHKRVRIYVRVPHLYCNHPSLLKSTHIIIKSPPSEKKKRRSLNKIPKALSQLQLLIVRVNSSSAILVDIGAVVSDFLQLELLVEAREHGAEDEAADDGGSEHGEGDGVAAAEAVGRKAPDVGAGDVADLREGVDHGDCYRTLGGRAREGGADPGVEDDEAVGGGRMLVFRSSG